MNIFFRLSIYLICFINLSFNLLRSDDLDVIDEVEMMPLESRKDIKIRRGKELKDIEGKNNYGYQEEYIEPSQKEDKEDWNFEFFHQ